MKLPNQHEAVVAEIKIVGYLLNDVHPKGKSKAKFFKSFGFSLEAWQTLAEALIRHAEEHEVVTITDTPLATIYTPDGRNPFIRSVWAIDRDVTFPHLVSAYPDEEAES
jgi:hypothetical protein